MATPTIYKGDDATIYISGLKHDILGVSDFSLTISKGVSEQELIGEKSNFFLAGAISCEGSLTACKLHSSAVSKLVGNMVDGGGYSLISGSCGANSLQWCLASCQITSFDFSLGTADEITEGSLDFSSVIPYRISVQTSSTETRIRDC
jgi:hypothetical protein